MYHFGSNLYKHVVIVGLKTVYDQEKSEVHKWVRRIYRLSFMPIDSILDRFDRNGEVIEGEFTKIKASVPEDYRVKCEKFL